MELLKLSPQQIWSTDLDRFVTEWQVSCLYSSLHWPDREQLALDEDAAVAKDMKPKTKAAIKAAQKKKRKADGDDSDESDNYRPVKAAIKPKAAKPAGSRQASEKPSPVKRAK